MNISIFENYQVVYTIHITIFCAIEAIIYFTLSNTVNVGDFGQVGEFDHPLVDQYFSNDIQLGRNVRDTLLFALNLFIC